MQDALFELNVECPVKVIQGELYVRISAWVYNEPADYVKLAEAVERVIARGGSRSGGAGGGGRGKREEGSGGLAVGGATGATVQVVHVCASEGEQVSWL